MTELEHQQVAQWLQSPHGLGSPEQQLQKLEHSCNLQQIEIIMQALGNEHEKL